jgi:hypothetical protein
MPPTETTTYFRRACPIFHSGGHYMVQCNWWAFTAPFLDKAVGVINRMKSPALPGGGEAAQLRTLHTNCWG